MNMIIFSVDSNTLKNEQNVNLIVLSYLKIFIFSNISSFFSFFYSIHFPIGVYFIYELIFIV